MLEKIDLSKKADKETCRQVMEQEGERLARLQRDGVVWDADARVLVRRCAVWIEAALTDPPVTV